jgi:glycosyltransferase involved in cell wall biosynthesis
MKYPNKYHTEIGGISVKGFKKQNLPGKPLVSVITVTFNRSVFLEKAIQSVLNQTYDNLEYIIIDGASIDNTINLLSKYNNKIDYWLSEPDQGMYYALNNGIGLANGELIGICHSDDYLIDEYVIEHLVRTHLEMNADVYHGDMIPISENGLPGAKIISNADRIFKTHNSIIHPTTFIKREVLLRSGLYNTSYKSAADYELMLRLKLNNCKFYHLGITVCAMRSGENNRVSNNCYSHLEAYRFHKELHTGNHLQYLTSYLRCSTTRFAKRVLNKLGLLNK